MTVAYPSNISFAYDNIVFDATTITPGSEVATMPAENLRLQERGAFWRATGHDSEALTLTLPKAKPFNLLGLVEHNLSLDATVRIQASLLNDFSGTTAYDETFTVGADLATARGYAAPDGKVSPPNVFFLDPGTRAAGSNAVLLGADDAFSAADHADFKPTGAFTVGAWVKKSAPPTSAWVSIAQSSRYASAVGYGWYLRIWPGTGQVYFYSWAGTGNTLGTHVQRIYGSTNICDDEWHLVVATWTGTTLNLYVDGKPDATAVSWATAPGYNATNYVRIGCACDNGTNSFFLEGSLDDVFLYNGTALTEAQQADIFNNGITITTNLKAQYGFASGALTTDSSR